MKELKKKKLSKGGESPTKQKVKLARGTRFVSVLFIALSILISAGILRAANVYYDLDTQSIYVDDKQQMNKGLTINGATGSSLTGTANPDGTAILPGTGTLFTSELVVGDRITVNSETRTVVAITSNSSLTVDTAFTDTPGGATIARLPAEIVVRDSSGNIDFVSQSDGNVGIGVTSPSAYLQLKAGVDVAGSAPFKFSSGALLTNEEPGALEYDGTHLYITDGAGVRFKLDQQAGTTYLDGKNITLNSNTFDLDATLIDMTSIDSASAGSLAIGDTNAVTINIGSTAATVLNIGAGGSLARQFDIGTGTGIDTINIGTGGTGVDVISIGSSVANLGLADADWSIANTGAASFLSGSFGGGYGSTGVTISSGGDISASGILTLGEASNNGTPADGKITLKNSSNINTQTIAAGAVSETIEYVLPAATPQANQVLVAGAPSGGTSTLSWATSSSIAGGRTLVGQVQILGFDYPVRTADTNYIEISKRMLGNMFPVPGALTREYKFSIRYADTLDPSAGSPNDVSNWQVYKTNGTPQSIAVFDVPAAPGTADADLLIGNVHVTAVVDLSAITATDEWVLRVKLPTSGKKIQIYSVEWMAVNVN